MRIIGIDPGTALCGVGIIEGDRRKGFSCLHYTCIKTQANEKIDKRLKIIFEELNKIIKEYKPEILAIEELFFFKNPKTVMSVSRASGVIIVAAAINNIEIKEFTPLEVKVAVGGYGRAEKQQIQKMITKLLKLKEIPKPDDAADALAIALCAGVSVY